MASHGHPFDPEHSRDIRACTPAGAFDEHIHPRQRLVNIFIHNPAVQLAGLLTCLRLRYGRLARLSERSTEKNQDRDELSSHHCLLSKNELLFCLKSILLRK
jgi:hypothetical protein